ncbi:Atg11 [Kluyveromyces lactis]|nr:Atg11 [Kluyveromyces lactis]
MPPCKLICATSGVSHELSDVYFPSFIDLKQFASDTFQIPLDDILLLLPYGMILKKAGWDSRKLQQEGLEEIYVFDRGIFNEEIEFSPKPRFQLFKPLPSPMSDSLQLDKNVILRNLGWLKALQSDVEFFQDVIKETYQDVQRLLECGTVMLEYLKNYCHEVEVLYNGNVDFLNKLHEDGASNQWHSFYDNILGNIKVSNQLLSSFFNYSELTEIEDSIHRLDRELNAKLKELKKSIDECYQQRTQLISDLDDVKKISVVSSDDMDNQMVERFREMATEMELVSNQYKEEASKDALKEKFETFKSVHVPKLQTISQAMFNKAFTNLDTKATVQKKLQQLYLSVAKSQMSVIMVKSVLTKDVKTNMKFLKNEELKLSQVLDLPMCYGLYLIELYREQLWTDRYSQLRQQHESSLQHLLDDEVRQRKSWYKDFQWITRFLDVDSLLPSSVYIPSISDYKQVTLSQIKDYINQLASLSLGEPTINLLKSKVSQAELTGLHLPTDYGLSKDSELIIEGYKARIKKLEHLLLDAQFHQYDSWPAGILNKETAMVQMFRNSTVSTKLQQSSTFDPPSSKQQQESNKTFEEFQNLQNDISKYSELTKTLETELSTLKSQLSHMEVEKNAYRESMTNLNKELSTLLIERENFYSEMNSRSENFKKHLGSLFEQNEELVRESEESKRKFEDLNKMKEDLLVNMATQEVQAEQERASLQEEVESLKKDLNQLQISKSKAIDAEFINFNKQLEKTLYDVFQGSIFILASIGLLLSKDQDGNFQIVRVKGLRKDLDSSLADMNSSMAKSVIAQEIKSTFESIKDQIDYKPHENFITYIEKLFGNQLFETSVIRRFNDIESLAKKLRKENKNKKLLLQKSARDKITIYNFQPGDLALFLPINDQELLLNSSISSLNSSFSSIDLNSSTQSVMQRPNVVKSDIAASVLNGSSASITENISSSKANRNIALNTNGRPDTFNVNTQDSAKKHVVWAIFTATNTDIKYFLRNSTSNYELLKDREWAMGRISALEKHVVGDDSNNPFKFPRNTMWYEVDAFFNLD